VRLSGTTAPGIHFVTHLINSGLLAEFQEKLFATKTLRRSSLNSFWVGASHCRNGESDRRLPDLNLLRGRSLSTGLSTGVAGGGRNVGNWSGLKAGDPEWGGGIVNRDRPLGPGSALHRSVAAAFLTSASAQAAFCSSALLRISGATFTQRRRWGIRCCFGFPVIDFSVFRAYTVNVRIAVFLYSHQ
jgi:hypothetical protein